MTPAQGRADTSTLGVTARVGYDLLQTGLRGSLNGGKALTSTYQGTAANGHATVRAAYRAELPRLTLSQAGPSELQLAVPVTVTGVGRDGSFLSLDKLASLGYRENGCTTLTVTARAAVTLELDRGSLKLRESPSTPAGAIERGTCTVTKKPAKDIAKLLGGIAGNVVGFVGTLLGDKKLSKQGEAMKRQVNALPDHVAVHDLVRAAVDGAVQGAVAAALSAGQDRLLHDLFHARISQGLQRTLSAGDNLVSLDLRPMDVTIDQAVLDATGLVIEAKGELTARLGFAGSASPGAGRTDSSNPGFALPLEFVLPVRKIASPEDGGEWLIPLSAAGQSIGLTSVPGEVGLVRLRLHQADVGPQTIIYLSAAGAPETMPNSPGPKGELDALLMGLVGWLDAGGQLPPEAHGSARALGGYVEAFRQRIALILQQIARLGLTEQATLKVEKPRLRVFPGRYADGLIRLPVTLIGQASIDVSL